ncbi:unnamed protein product [Cunninghamella blakesleeana]
MKKRPLNTLAIALGLNDPHFNSDYESSEKLIYIIGTLSFHHGSSTVDSFLHPLFINYIFTEQQSPQNKNESDSFLQFPQMVISKGGTLMDSYEKMAVKALNNPQDNILLNNSIGIGNSNNGTRWICSIKYRLVHDGPWLQHDRQGRSKKIARMRAICDIYNYYKRNGALLITHCSSQLINNNSNHNSTIINRDDTHSIEKLNIPIELLYQYDDNDFVNNTTETNPSNNKSDDNNNNNINNNVDETMLRNDNNNINDNNVDETMLCSDNNNKNDSQLLIPTVQTNQLGKRSRKHPEILYIPAQPIVDGDDEIDDFLVQALLGDFSNMTCEEALMTPQSVTSTSFKSFDQNNNNNNNNNNSNNNSNNNNIFSSSSPLSSTSSTFGSSGVTYVHEGSVTGNIILSSSTSTSTSSSMYESPLSPLKENVLSQTDIYIKSETVTSNTDMYHDDDRHEYKKLCLIQSSNNYSNDNNNNNNIHHTHQNTMTSTNIILPTPGLQMQQNQHHLQYEAYELKENLTKQAQLCLQHLSTKDKERLLNHSEYLKTRPHDAKGYLINLSNKLNGGHFDIKVTSLTSSSSCPVFSARATFGAAKPSTFGNDEFEIQVVYNASKKTTSEGMAAYSIVNILKDQLATPN